VEPAAPLPTVAAFPRDPDLTPAPAINGGVSSRFGRSELCDLDAHRLEAAKLAALAEFAAGAGHEINNPLATIVGRAQALLTQETDPGRRQSLATIAAQAFRIRDMIGDLMVFARPPAPVLRRLILNEVIRTIVGHFQDDARERSCSLTFDEECTVFISADPTQLNVVLSELVRNSLDAVPPSSGEIQMTVASTTVEDRSYAVAVVADNGRGLNETDRAHLFDPFYSGREAGRGLGFGLCKVWRIVTNHGGWIEVESAPKLGSTFRLYWPDAAVDGSTHVPGPLSK
jgi:signal transduction histidine kinase